MTYTHPDDAMWGETAATLPAFPPGTPIHAVADGTHEGVRWWVTRTGDAPGFCISLHCFEELWGRSFDVATCSRADVHRMIEAEIARRAAKMARVGA